jgi:hypothetical protein
VAWLAGEWPAGRTSVSADENAGPPDAVAVHRDVLRAVAHRLRSDLAALDAAVTRVQAAGPGTGSLYGWPAGDVFGDHVTSTYQASLRVARELGDAHHAVITNLAATAASYDAAEADSVRAVRAVPVPGLAAS